MIPPCPICKCPARAEIDRHLREMASTGATIKGLARRFKVDEGTLERHHDRHLIEPETDADEILETMRSATKNARSEEIKGESPSVQASASVPNSGAHQSRCKCCKYPNHQDLDKDLLSGKLSVSNYAKIVGCSPKSVSRHKAHIGKEIAVSTEAENIINADSLLDQLREARKKALEILDLAIEAADTRVYGAPSQYLTEIRKQIQLINDIEAGIPQEPISLALNPEWQSLRALILTSLDPYPEARAAMVTAIESHRGQN